MLFQLFWNWFADWLNEFCVLLIALLIEFMPLDEPDPVDTFDVPEPAEGWPVWLVSPVFGNMKSSFQPPPAPDDADCLNELVD